MIPKRSGQCVTPVFRFVEGGQLSLERHRYSLGVDNPEAPLSAKTGRLPVTNQVTTPGNTRRRATPSDTDCPLACGNPT